MSGVFKIIHKQKYIIHFRVFDTKVHIRETLEKFIRQRKRIWITCLNIYYFFICIRIQNSFIFQKLSILD